MTEIVCRLIDVDWQEFGDVPPGWFDAHPGEGWTLRQIIDTATGAMPVSGDMWSNILETEGRYRYGRRRWLSRYYDEHNAHRLPLMVVLPTGYHHCVDSCYWGGAHGDNEARDGWTVTGTAPLITVAPSINIVGHWHGFLEHGILRG